MRRQALKTFFFFYWTDQESKALPECTGKIRKIKPVYLMRITAQFKTQTVNKVKDNVAVPGHEKGEKNRSENGES